MFGGARVESKNNGVTAISGALQPNQKIIDLRHLTTIRINTSKHGNFKSKVSLRELTNITNTGCFYVNIPYLEAIKNIQICSYGTILHNFSVYELFMFRSKFESVYELPCYAINVRDDIEIIIKTVCRSRADKIFRRIVDPVVDSVNMIKNIKNIISEYISMPSFDIGVYFASKELTLNFRQPIYPLFSDANWIDVAPSMDKVTFEYEPSCVSFAPMKYILFYFTDEWHSMNFMDIVKSVNISGADGARYYDRSMCLLLNSIVFCGALQEGVYGILTPFVSDVMIYDKYDRSNVLFTINLHPVEMGLYMRYFLYF